MALLGCRHVPVAMVGTDPDGEDDGETGPLPALAMATRVEWVPAPPPPEGTYPKVCDLRGHHGSIYVSHLTKALQVDGAQVHRYDAAGWTRIHENQGEGISRLRVIGGRLYAVDTEAPGLGGGRLEDYLYIGDRLEETRVLPEAIHAFDVAAYRGVLVVTGGTIPMSGAFSWRRGPFPGGIWVGDTTFARTATVGGLEDGVVRTTFLHRFRGQLFVGLQNNEDRIGFDLVVLGADLSRPSRRKVTAEGGWMTRRFASGRGTLWWVATKQGRAALWRSRDGETFVREVVPGQVQDVAVAGDEVYVLSTAGLFRREGERLVAVGGVPPGDPFGAWDAFCSAPLEIAAGGLWAGSLRDGRLWQVVPVASALTLVDGVGRTEVTNAQFAAFVAATGYVTDAERTGSGFVWDREWRRVRGASWRHPHGPASDLRRAGEHAVVQVSARDAEAFCAHHGLRLPTETEWEAAAVGATIGNGGATRCCAPEARDGFLRVAPVASFAAVRGRFDLIGNVWEWTSTGGESRIIKGGGWGNSPEALTPTIAHRNRPDTSLDMVGVRCVR
jgi:formylglycine-generating enzyme